MLYFLLRHQLRFGCQRCSVEIVNGNSARHEAFYDLSSMLDQLLKTIKALVNIEACAINMLYECQGLFGCSVGFGVGLAS